MGEAGIGTSAFLHGAALTAALGYGIPSTIVSLADSGVATCRRLMARLTRVPTSRLLSGALGDEDWSLVSLAVKTLVEAPLEIVELTGADYADVALAVLAAGGGERGPRLIIVDSVDRIVHRPSPTAIRDLGVAESDTLLLVNRSAAVPLDLASGASGVLRLRANPDGLRLERLLDLRLDRPAAEWPVAVQPGRWDMTDRPAQSASSAQLSFDVGR